MIKIVRNFRKDRSEWIRSKKSIYLIDQIESGYIDRKWNKKIFSTLFIVNLYTLMTLIVIFFDPFDWFDSFRRTVCFRIIYGEQYFLVTICYILIDISILFIAYTNFIPLNENMFILLPYILINWALDLKNQKLYCKKIIEDCDRVTLKIIKLIIINFELLCTSIIATLYFFTSILSVGIVLHHLINENDIFIILLDLSTFIISIMNARLFLDFANNNTVYITVLKTFFCGNFKQINQNYRNNIDDCRDERIQIKSIQNYLNHHNDLCKLLRQANYAWSFGNFVTIIFNLPVNIILINIVIHYELSTIEKSSQSSSPLLIQSLRLRIKLLNYLERLSSKQKQLGVSIGPGKPITHWKLWKLLSFYGAYFLNTYSVLNTKSSYSI
ncbi:hypothetical protein NH340_JMT07829 [Sarcoptes scabiei]|nr:hypothetical protein NH340_JMT07829 [Sarcoptes scabiei]